jgi:thiol-disulfide isomerase/thioredoxin
VVYVAPWCGPCRSSLPGDVALADYIRTKGYETVFVVGMDKPEACLDMTRSLGRPARLDTEGKWAKAAGIRGVPHFLVTTPAGKIVKRQAGAYMAPPDQVAQFLGIS